MFQYIDNAPAYKGQLVIKPTIAIIPKKPTWHFCRFVV